MTVITLSRQLGSHSREVAEEVARALNLRLIDAQTINQAAQQAGVPERALAELEHEGGQSLAGRVLKALRAMPALSPGGEVSPDRADAPSLTLPFVGLFSPTVSPLSASLEGYVRIVGLVIQGLAKEGNVLIMGRGSQVLLRKHSGAFHVQIVAPVPDRVKTVMVRFKLDKKAAENRVRASDHGRADYLRRYHGVDWLEPTLYHLVINTGHIPVATAAGLIVRAHQAVMPPGSTTSGG
jgi:cytidylate kinase